MFLSQAAFAVDSVKTKYGQLEIKSIGEDEKGLFFGSKVIFKRELGYLDIVKVFHVKAGEVALVSSNEGGSGTPNSYFFVNIKPDASVIVKGEFFPQITEIKPVQKEDKIIVDLGYNEGVQEILTYSSGKQSIEKLKGKGKNEQTDEDGCNYLYNDIYVEYVKNQQCNSAPEEISGMSTARDYNSMSNDPRYNFGAFQTLSVTSCKKGEWIKYSEFKNKICGG